MRIDSKYFILAFLFIAAFSSGIANGKLLRKGFLNKFNRATNAKSKYASLCNRFSYFSQIIDHFNFNPDTDYTFSQRYIISDEYVAHESPIFFYTGNEGDIQWFCENTGFVWELAAKFNALVIFAEHRYYGQSLPYGNKSFENPYIGYLTSEQALADYAYLIQYIKSSRTSFRNSPVIAFGGSYGGMLSAWFRMKYPNLVQGALAASAPVRQFVVPCESFLETTTNTFRQADPACPNIIRASWGAINTLSETSAGLRNLSDIFHLCEPVKDAQILKDYLNDLYGNAAMGDYPYAANFLSPLPAWPVKAICSNIVGNFSEKHKKTNDPLAILNSLYSGLNIYLNYTGQTKCVDIYTDMDSANINMNAWLYQTCTEFVFPMCSNGKTDMFEPDEWDFKSYCLSCYNQFKTVPRSEWPAISYGVNTDDLKSYSNIIFSNGDLDPWSAGGFLADVNDRISAIIIKDGAHHLDLRASNSKDPVSVIEARLKETDAISRWIREHFNKDAF